MMTQLAKDDIILQTALHFGADHLYYIKDSNMGLTLYAEVRDREEARILRKELPSIYEGLRTIVIYYDKRG